MENKKEQKIDEETSNNDVNSASIYDITKIRDEIISDNSDKLEQRLFEKKYVDDFIIDTNRIDERISISNVFSDEDNEFISNRFNQFEKTYKQNEVKDKLKVKSLSESENNEKINFDSFDKIISNNEYFKYTHDIYDNFNSKFEKNKSIKKDNYKLESINLQSNSQNTSCWDEKETQLKSTGNFKENRNNHNKNKEDENKYSSLSTKRLIHPYSNNNITNISKIDENINYKTNEEFPKSNMDLQRENFKIDIHLDKIGYRMFHYRMIFIISLVLFIDACEMSNVNMLLSSIQNDLNLNTFQKSSLSSIIFIGHFIGSFLSGFTTNRYGRLTPIKYGVVLIFIFSFLTSISRTITQLIILRILSGLSIGTVVPACKTLLTECIPSFYRSFVLSIVWLLHPIGFVYICYVALNCVEGNEFNWRKVFMINSLGSFLLIILVQFLTESPRYLLKNGKTQEAIKLLDIMGNSNIESNKIMLSEDEKNLIYVEARMLQGIDIDEHRSNNSN